MQSMHAGVVRRLLASLDDRCVDFLLRLVDDFLDATGWIRPSETSFSSASRATSRRIGSKHETTTVSGVSSMMTSTPVASSNARIFDLRVDDSPLHFIIREDTADTVVSAVVSAAIR